jgi:hypothetical protein
MRNAVVRRILCAVVLGLCALGASANVAQAAAQLGHGCCHPAPANSSAAPETPCDGFLPLTCCHAAALPGGDPASAPPAPLTVAHVEIAVTPRAAIARHGDAALAPRIAPTRLSVVRQV